MWRLATSLLERYRTPLLLCVGVGIIVLIVVRQWSSVGESLSSVSPSMAFYALILLVCANACVATLFAFLALNKEPGGYEVLEFSSVFMVTQSAKYVPGKVWSIMMQMAYLRGRLGAGLMVVANIEVMLLVLGSISAVSLAIAVGIATEPLLGVCVAVFCILFALMIVGWWPLRRLVFHAATRLGSKSAALSDLVRKDIESSRIVGSCLALLGFTIFYLSGWFIFAGPALDIDADIALRWVGLMSASYVVGVLSMFPAGIGAREAAIYLLAAYSGVDTGQAASIAVLSRIMILVIDVCGVFLGAAVLFAVRFARGGSR